VRSSDDFGLVAELLAAADLRNSDFEPVINEAKEGDLVFADPPYTVSHNNNGFQRYNERLFSWEDQRRLASALARAKLRGAMIVATNADHEPVKELYRAKGFTLTTVGRASLIASDSGSRNHFREVIIRGNC
jgi:DNA adenine methylase